MPRFSRRAKRHAAESRMRTKRMHKNAHRRSGPVTVSYLPGFEPAKTSRTKFPFTAWINGEEVTVWGVNEITRTKR